MVRSRLGSVVSLNQLRDKKYGLILCYPKYNLQDNAKRISELNRLGVKALEFTGQKTIFGVPVSGKGNVGIVVIAHLKHKKVALKIRRVDADRASMEHETAMLKIANAVRVGPEFIGDSENFLVMGLVNGAPFPKWVEELKGRGTRKSMRPALRNILEQCWRLDQKGLDHGELSRAAKHIIIDTNSKPYILDFETASVQRRVSNVTSVSQYLFIGSKTAKIIRGKLGKLSLEGLKLSLKNYKLNHTLENLDKIFHECGLDKVE